MISAYLGIGLMLGVGCGIGIGYVIPQDNTEGRIVAVALIILTFYSCNDNTRSQIGERHMAPSEIRVKLIGEVNQHIVKAIQVLRTLEPTEKTKAKVTRLEKSLGKAVADLQPLQLELVKQMHEDTEGTVHNAVV